jgi:hypothetical protein
MPNTPLRIMIMDFDQLPERMEGQQRANLDSNLLLMFQQIRQALVDSNLNLAWQLLLSLDPESEVYLDFQLGPELKLPVGTLREMCLALTTSTLLPSMKN